MAEVLASQPLPKGNKLLVISNAGGPAVLAGDAISIQGGQIAPLAEETWQRLRQVLPPYWSGGNPIDILGDASPATYRKVLELCNADPSPDGFLAILTPQGMTDPTQTAESIVAIKDTFHRPILVSWMGAATVQGGIDSFSRAGIPNFDTPEHAIRAFLYMHQYSQNLELQYETPAVVREEGENPQAVEEVFQAIRRGGRLLATEVESKQVFKSYGIPVVETQVAITEDEAAALAGRLGYPVVLKIHSSTITHKTAVGGVRLNLMDERTVRMAFRDLEGVAKRVAPQETFQGVSVQPMISEPGLEAIVGCTADDQFGPVILFGAGGTMVEVFRDRALGLPPMNRTVARRLIESTRLYAALTRAETNFPASIAQLEEILVRFSALVLNHPQIKEIDVNPLWIGPGRILALDGRISLYPEERERPPLAIGPYPRQYESRWALRDGTPVLIRPIRPEDEPLMVDLFTTFSLRTIHMRFFGLIKQMTHDQLIRTCNIDYDREVSLVALCQDGVASKASASDGQPERPELGRRERLIGAARLVMESDRQSAEYAVVVGDPWQRQGLGRHFMELIIPYAKERGLAEIHGDVLTANEPMLALCEQLHFSIHRSEVKDVVRVSRKL